MLRRRKSNYMRLLFAWIGVLFAYSSKVTDRVNRDPYCRYHTFKVDKITNSSIVSHRRRTSLAL